MAYYCVFFLLFYQIVILTYHSTASGFTIEEENRFLFVEPDKDIFTRKPNVVSINSLSDNSDETIIPRNKRDTKKILPFSFDSNQPKNISTVVSNS